MHLFSSDVNMINSCRAVPADSNLALYDNISLLSSEWFEICVCGYLKLFISIIVFIQAFNCRLNRYVEDSISIAEAPNRVLAGFNVFVRVPSTCRTQFILVFTSKSLQ